MSSDSQTLTATRVVLVTGPSGAGRSTAINALEDLGYEAIDNMPVSLVPRLVDGPAPTHPLALGIDVRNREFSVEALLELCDTLRGWPGVAPELLYLDCRPDVLVRRYSETRRRHPLTPDAAPTEGIARERALLDPVREAADTLIDTSEFSPHELRDELVARFGPDGARPLAVTLSSFSYKRGVPQGADMILDCRFLANPHWIPELRDLTGLDPEVVAHVAADPLHAGFLERVEDMLRFLLPAYRDEGKAHFAVAFGCTGGQHRSVAVTEAVARGLAEVGWRVSIRHRELERRGLIGDSRPTPQGIGRASA
ncbi:RNase adapter RapZ [Roseivivax isoporae]|uniref:GlmZ(SRNA)-inactivating NTPase n=1 Tax=Roseivivax isoporae LMG 25204 TaxID=1449351 RepID=X7FDI7_9RHOB|nr:RNase adapter RapZ [Roseivivax isoporae]ETX30875.1 glmZ(sRNA)-inactivating NTPase [Roseivivax isoporae LMG 25204]